MPKNNKKYKCPNCTKTRTKDFPIDTVGNKYCPDCNYTIAKIKKVKSYFVESTISIDVEAKNKKEAIELFWANIRGCKDDLETIINSCIKVIEL